MLYTIKDITRAARISRESFRELIRIGMLPGPYLCGYGSDWYYMPADKDRLVRWLKQNRRLLVKEDQQAAE